MVRRSTPGLSAEYYLGGQYFLQGVNEIGMSFILRINLSCIVRNN